MSLVLHAAPAWSVPPWTVDLTASERNLIDYAVVVAAFGLAAMAIRMLSARREVGDRFRPAVHAGLGAVSIAFLSYVLLFLELRSGYDFTGGRWVANEQAVGTWSARFMDWTISVPLLVVELVAVSALTGSAARRVRGIGVTAGAAMAILGFVGAILVDDGRSYTALLGFGLASTACFVVLYIVVIGTVVRSLPVLPPAARGPLKGAMVLLVISWLVYPVVFGLQGVVAGGAVTAAGHVLLCAADLVAKVGFGLLLLRVARIRTAADVIAGEDVHPEGVWIDQLRHSDGAAARATTGALPGD